MTHCDSCGLPVDTQQEPCALHRDTVFVICDLCHAMADEQHSRLCIVLDQERLTLALKH